MFTAKDLTSLPEYLTYDDVLLLPQYSEVVPADTNTNSFVTNNIAVTVPIIASPMDTVCEASMAIAMAKLGGYGIIHRNFSISAQVTELKLALAQVEKVGVAVGVGQDFQDRVTALVEAGVKEICIDSAHGHSKNVIEAVKFIIATHPEVEVIAGNVATYEGARALFEAGATAVKVGMGPGSICTTRIMSGMGVPQLSAVSEGVRAAQEIGGKIIADGGIKTSGDIVKALAIGADTVILGSLLAGSDESPGDIIELEGKRFKSYRGMGSVSAMKEGSAARYGQKYEPGKAQKLVPEGIEGLVPARGPVAEHIYQLIGGVKAGLGYLGAANLSELRQKAHFIKITRNAVAESRPHSVMQQ